MPQQFRRDTGLQRAQHPDFKAVRAAFDGLRITSGQHVQPVLVLDNLLLNSKKLAPVFRNLRLETAHRQLRHTGSGLFDPDRFQRLLLHLQHPSINGQLAIQGQQIVVGFGNLGDEVRHHEIPPLLRGEVALDSGISLVAQLPPDVDLPVQIGRNAVVRQRIGKPLSGLNFEILFDRPVARVARNFVDPCGAPKPDKG